MNEYVEIIEPQRGYCKQFEAIPLLAKSYKMTDLTGAQKMRERQLRQLILEGATFAHVSNSYLSEARALILKETKF